MRWGRIPLSRQRHADLTSVSAVWDQNAPQKHARVSAPGESPSQAPGSCSWLLWVRETPGRGAAGLGCSAAGFPPVCLNTLLGIHGDISLTNASALRVKLF